MPAVELRYLGEMAELDHVKITAVYLLIRCMKFAWVRAGVGGEIKNTKDLKVLNFKKSMQSPNANEWHKEIWKEKGHARQRQMIDCNDQMAINLWDRLVVATD